MRGSTLEVRLGEVSLHRFQGKMTPFYLNYLGASWSSLMNAYSMAIQAYVENEPGK